MGKMPRNEDRELLIESYEKTHNAEEIAKIFGVNKYTVYHMAERKRKTGSVALRTSQRGSAFWNTWRISSFRPCIRERSWSWTICGHTMSKKWRKRFTPQA